MLGESVSDRESAVAQVFAFMTAGVIFVDREESPDEPEPDAG